MAWIRLTNSKKFAIVDAMDWELGHKHKWYLTKGGYAYRNSDNKSMHRLLLNAKKGSEVDHINGNKLDNRRENLRLVTHSENQRNSKLRKDNASGFKGVCWDKTKQKWMAYISLNTKNITIGYFQSRTEAAKARDKAAKKIHKEFAYLNF